MYSVYSHPCDNPEGDMTFMCSCRTMEMARLIVNALTHMDTGGRRDGSGLYDYYINEDK